MEQLLHKELSDKVLGMAFSVHNILGPGLLESAYDVNADFIFPLFTDLNIPVSA